MDYDIMDLGELRDEISKIVVKQVNKMLSEKGINKMIEEKIKNEVYKKVNTYWNSESMERIKTETEYFISNKIRENVNNHFDIKIDLKKSNEKFGDVKID